jgi:tetratricopeptide (TPR) repeat protein
MTTADASANQADKGKAFFERADEVAETGNWDYAIDLYLEGIRREPNNVARGHQKLREVSLKRKFKGGKPVGFVEHLKRRGGRAPIEALVNAEYLLAKDPGNPALMGQVLSAARALDLRETAGWICNIILDTQRQSAKPQRRVLMMLVEAYSYVEDFGLALAACQMAMQQAPGDAQLVEMYNQLSARHTIKAGRYGQEGDFTKSVKDMARQTELIQKDSMVQADSYLEQQIRRARQEYQAAPREVGKINAYVDAMLKIEDQAHEQEAINVLRRAHEETGAYQFKMRVGDIRLRQEDHKQRQLVESGDQEAAARHAKERLALEIEEFIERAANYPTDLGIKYELGVRYFRAGNYDEAIGALQKAKADPRRQLQALNYMGLAFARKGWLPEAVQTFEQTLQAELTEDQDKSIRYNLGDVYEQMGKLEQANEQFSKVAQMDFTFKDVRHRVEAVRKKMQDKPTGQP